MTATLINGREIAKEIRTQISDEINHLKKQFPTPPTVATIVIGKNPTSALYLKLRDAACKEVGIISHHRHFDEKVTEDTVLDLIGKLNSDTSVHGILIQYPVPRHISQERLMRTIDPQKDVEGFNPVNLGRTLMGDEYLPPCTPLAVLSILEHEHVDLKGKDVTVINHSAIVGKPLAALLLNRNATVSVCHVFTKNLMQYTTKADILITGAGVPKLITKDHVKDHSIIIDVGIIETSEGIRGDVDFQSVNEKEVRLTPVPGGVGPVTIACALKNMMKTYRNCIKNVEQF
jgi:methylenetetrahydrofolate dehydrogenase (NADP+)/methenyltetrahydrofolate cyclohydrolase